MLALDVPSRFDELMLALNAIGGLVLQKLLDELCHFLERQFRVWSLRWYRGFSFTRLLQFLLDDCGCEALVDAGAAECTLVAAAVRCPMVPFFSSGFRAFVHQPLLVLLGVCGLWALGLSWT